MTPEEAYAEARRRIREAKKTGALELYLGGLALNRLPRELARRANRHLARSRHLRQALGSGIQGDGAGLYAPWKRGPQALQGDEAVAQRSRRYARLCERRLAAPLMLDAYYSGTIVEYYFSKLFIISVLSSFSRLLCVIVRSL